MIEIKSKKGIVNIPNEWGELSQEQYLDVMALMYTHPVRSNSAMDMFEFRLRLLNLLSGYARSNKKYSPVDQEDINSILYILAAKMTFVYRPYYPETEIFEVMSEDLSEKLKISFPYDLSATDFAHEIHQFNDLVKYTPVINYNMKQNPLSVLKIKRPWKRSLKVKGPVFDIDPLGVAITNITAGEYVDAQDYYSLYNSTHEDRYLKALCFVFYRLYPGAYNAVKTQKQLNQNPEISDIFFLGFYSFFQNIQEYFLTHPVFKILYTSTETAAANKISLGNAESIYNAAANGYGNVEQIKNLNLADYMSLLVKDIKDGVATLRGYKKKDHEIAKALKLPIEIIKKI
jgi:hypothetical protein